MDWLFRKIDAVPEQAYQAAYEGLSASRKAHIDRLQKQEDTASLRRWLHSRLSKLEYPVLYLFLNGQSYEQIAEALSVTEKAVDNALQRIRKKIGNTFL